MVESGPTRRLVDKLHNVRRLLYANYMVQAKNAANKAMDGCVRNFDAGCRGAPEAYQNDRSYVRELSGLTFDSLRKNLAWWAVTWRTSKENTKLSKLWVGACPGQ